VAFDDDARLDRLVTRLADEAATRRGSLAAGQHLSMRSWWAAGDPAAPPPIVLLVDDWHRLPGHHGGPARHALVERLVSVIREGDAVGLTAMVTGDRSLMLGAMPALLTRRLLLRQADLTDWGLAGLAPGDIPAQLPPGRALLADGTELQLALPTTRPPMSARVPHGPLPLRVDALPPLVRASELDLVGLQRAEVPVGLGGDELAVLSLDEARDGRAWLVTGARRRGVSSVLLLLAWSLLGQGRTVAVVAARPGPLDFLRTDPRLALWSRPTDVDPLMAAARAQPTIAVVIDDADQLGGTPADAALCELASGVERTQGLVVCGGNATVLGGQYRGVARHVAQSRTGILLGPESPGDADLFGVRVRPDPGAPPGRGHLVRRGVASPLQVALPDQVG
jgi:S-DNA-T family DNA segregation ATPase FtsK/SpoIIIE